MALTSGEPNTQPHGGRRNNTGCEVFNSRSSRKSEWEKSQRRIRLEENIHKSWLQAKLEADIYRAFSRDVIKFFNPKLKSHQSFYPRQV